MTMSNSKIQQVWNLSYTDFSKHHLQSREQLKASHAIRNCKTGILGATLSQCSDCGHIEYHNNSCRNRNCPNCQAVKKELWVDRRRSEVICYSSHYPSHISEKFCKLKEGTVYSNLSDVASDCFILYLLLS